MRFPVNNFLPSIVIALFALCYGCTSVFPETYPFSLAPDTLKENTFMGIRLLDSIGMRLKTPDGDPVSELSGLAWDEDEQVLYAVSDEGLLHHLKLKITDDQIQEVHVAHTEILKNKKGKPLKGKKSDSEGLCITNGNNGIRGDTQIFISFEGKPRIIKYTPAGIYLEKVHLPGKLRNTDNYRGKNKALESVTIHPVLGILTAAEYPLKAHSMKDQTLYSTTGQEYHFTASPARKSAVTGLSLLPNGNVLVLERAWSGIQYPIVNSLREVDIGHCSKTGQCQVKDLAVMSSATGWYNDNFEGVTKYKGNRYFMVSDNNENSFQTTILALFEILPQPK